PSFFRATVRAATQQLWSHLSCVDTVRLVRLLSPGTAAITTPLLTISRFTSGRKKLADAVVAPVSLLTCISSSGPLLTTTLPLRTPAAQASYGDPAARAYTSVRSGPSNGSQRGHGFLLFNGTGKSLPAMPVT